MTTRMGDWGAGVQIFPLRPMKYLNTNRSGKFPWGTRPTRLTPDVYSFLQQKLRAGPARGRFKYVRK